MRLLLFFLLAFTTAQAAEPIPKSDGTTPAKSKFKFPVVIPTSDPPAPPPAPGAVPLLTGEVLYVVPADEAFLLFDSPKGIVTVTRETGPLRIRGKFLDGNGKVETRNYQQKNLAIIEAVPGAKGRVELIAVPVGATDEGKAERMLVDIGVAPQPPPDVDPPAPKPVDPPKPVEPVVTSFRVIWIHESGSTDKAHQTANTVAGSKMVRDYLDANTTKNENWPGWRRWDKDQSVSSDFAVFQDLWKAVQPKITTVPCVAVEVNGKVNIEPQPQTPQDAIALFKKFTNK